MVMSCSAFGCKSQAKRGNKFSFFSFPRDPKLLDLWKKAIARKGFTPSKHSRVCSVHFEKTDYYENPGGSYLPKLKSDAVPSKFLAYPSSHMYEPKVKVSKPEFHTKTPMVNDIVPLPSCSRDLFNVKTDNNTILESNVPLAITELVTPFKEIPKSPIYITPSKKIRKKVVVYSPRLKSPSKICLKNKIKLLQQKVRRQKTKINNLKDFLTDLKNKNLIGREDENNLIDKFDGLQNDVVQNMMKNKNRSATGSRYSKEIKEFALTLNYYSPKAYSYARKILNLPHEKSIRNWTSSINAEPGFFSEVLHALKSLAPEDKNCNIMFDAMSIKKQIIWDMKLNRFVGNCDFGNSLDIEGTETAATEVLVFMAVSLNGKWKLPIGYFLQDKVNAVAQAELLKSALVLTYNSGLRVWGVICDGAPTNFSTMKILGCVFGVPYDEIVCSFNHPANNALQVYFVPDACHMLKLARNTLGNCKILESNLGFIRWDHIAELHSVQKELTLKFGNKLSKAHIDWMNNKMKVCFAAQTLSASTADSLDFLQSNKYPKFSNVQATAEYCRVVDRIFDFLNSKNPFSKGFKSPIFHNNIHILKSMIIPLVKYLFSLKINGNYLYKAAQKTFIIGFSVAIKSIFSIADVVFKEIPCFKYFLTYKFSQDHLELFFARIRQRYGTNNNPNVIQLKTAIKQILLKNAIKCKSNSNCNTFDDDIFGAILEFKWNKNKNVTENDAIEIDEEVINRAILLNNSKSYYQEAKENIMYYITGYVIRKIGTSINCENCIQSLIKKVTEHNYSQTHSHSEYLNFKNKGGLVWPSESSYKVIFEAEKILLILTENLKKLHVQNLDHKIILYVINKFTTDSSIFSDLACENVEILERPHKIVLISALTKRYLSVRLKSFGKMYSCDILNPVSKRHKLTKQILFTNQ